MDEAEIIKLSRMVNLPEKELKKILDAVSKPTLKNIDCLMNNSFIGSSDKII